PLFNTARMVREYATRAYFPASDRYFTLTADKYTPVKELSVWRLKLNDNWYNIKIKDVEISSGPDIKVNQTVTVKAKIDLASLSNNDVQVELYQGTIDANGEIVNGESVVMNIEGNETHGLNTYTANITYTTSGLQGLSLRVLPQHKHLATPYEPRLIVWAQ
ncbi:MAG: glycosyltransferase family 1 protein, partial [Calothrix sp. SM1_7_51]|nr:glycosyltransferase family 1 protein [Calothrix sp. SM1_7_51]